MKPEFTLPFNMPNIASTPVSQSKQSDAFSAQQVEARNTAFRDHLIAAQPAKKTEMNPDDRAYIQEHGFSAYAEKVHEDKRTEMREEILRNMNLTEELLNAMEPEQRAVIERMIEDDIQNKMAANSLINSDRQDNSSKTSGLFKGSHNTVSPVISQLMTADQNAGSLLSTMKLLEQSNTPPKIEDDQ